MSTFEAQISSTLTKLQSELSPEEKAGLSSVLFPDEHITHVFVLGARRELRPLTIKWARKLRAVMQPYAKKLDEATKKVEVVDIDMDLLDGLKDACRVLGEHYGWEDIIKAVEEDDLTMTEIQSIVAAQVKLQGENDFLFIPLRVAVMVMQAVEIQNRRYRTIFGG